MNKIFLKPQDKDYNCGVFSVNFLLSLYGHKTDCEQLEKIMRSTEKDGTDHNGIIRGLIRFELNVIQKYNCTVSDIPDNVPSIINYQSGGDGHYSVIIGRQNKKLIIYDPEFGCIRLIALTKKNWFSKRFGKGWLCYIKS